MAEGLPEINQVVTKLNFDKKSSYLLYVEACVWRRGERVQRGGHGKGAPEGVHGCYAQMPWKLLGRGGWAQERKHRGKCDGWSQSSVMFVYFKISLSHPRQPGEGQFYWHVSWLGMIVACSAIASPLLAWSHENIRMICGMGSFSEANCDDEGEWGATPRATYLEGPGLLKALHRGPFRPSFFSEPWSLFQRSLVCLLPMAGLLYRRTAFLAWALVMGINKRHIAITYIFSYASSSTLHPRQSVSR